VQRFVFLEFTDIKVRKLLSDLRIALEGLDRKQPVHITIRGPYSELPDVGILEQLQEELMGHGVIIGGAGTFQSHKGYTVYLKAQSPVFSRIWWKPDFPEERFGIKPHITMFETNDRRAARAVETFLRSERIEIFTFGLRVSVFTSKQLSLFEGEADDTPRHGSLIGWKVRPGLLERAMRLNAEPKVR
jgi:hypothetical protein